MNNMFNCKVYLGDVEFYYITRSDLSKIIDAFHNLPKEAFGDGSLLQFMRSGIVISQLYELGSFSTMGGKGVFLNQWQVDHAEQWMGYSE